MKNITRKLLLILLILALFIEFGLINGSFLLLEMLCFLIFHIWNLITLLFVGSIVLVSLICVILGLFDGLVQAFNYLINLFLFRGLTV